MTESCSIRHGQPSRREGRTALDIYVGSATTPVIQDVGHGHLRSALTIARREGWYQFGDDWLYLSARDTSGLARVLNRVLSGPEAPTGKFGDFLRDLANAASAGPLRIVERIVH
jgi:hypothetical protein